MLESGDTHSRRPSGETMYSLAKELGVAMSDLLVRIHCKDGDGGNRTRAPFPPSLDVLAQCFRGL